MAFILSAALLFLTGVLVGANIGGSKALSEIFPWILSTKQEMNTFAERVGELERDVLLLTLMDKDVKCRTAGTLLRNAWADLEYFWSVLPYRIEEENVSEDVLKAYYSTSVRAWVLADYYWRECNSAGRIPTLYVLRRGDVNAGRILDKFHSDLIIFVTELNTGIPLSDAILDAYNVNEAPSLILCGKVVPVEEEAIKQELKACRGG